jgi:hypothetical protein
METPVDVKKITWIHRQRYSERSSTWYVYLDSTMSRSYLILSEGEVAHCIWVAFLALPAVHVFERGTLVVAYNFAKVEQAVISGHFGGFAFDEPLACGSSSITLQSLYEDVLDLALPAFRLWLHAQLPAQEYASRPSCVLTVTLAAAQRERVGNLLDERFPGISLAHEGEDTACYRWTFGLDTWLNEAQCMLLGLYEHTIRIPGFMHQEQEDEQQAVFALLSLLSPGDLAPAWDFSEASRLPAVPLPWRTHRRYPRFLVPLLMGGITGGTWWIWRQVKQYLLA